MKENFCFFLPATLESVEGFITLMSLAGSNFDKDYTMTPLELFVRVDVASNVQYNIARNVATKILRSIQ